MQSQDSALFQEATIVDTQTGKMANLMSMFDYQIIHIPGPQLVQADVLSRQPDHMESDKEEAPETLLPEWLFISATGVSMQDNALINQIRQAGEQDKILTEALEALKTGKLPPMQSSLTDWYNYEGILFYKGKIYIPDDLELCREITQWYHNIESAGHPE